MNLPSSFTNVIKKYGIDSKDIVFAAVADLDEDSGLRILSWF